MDGGVGGLYEVQGSKCFGSLTEATSTSWCLQELENAGVYRSFVDYLKSQWPKLSKVSKG